MGRFKRGLALALTAALMLTAMPVSASETGETAANSSVAVENTEENAKTAETELTEEKTTEETEIKSTEETESESTEATAKEETEETTTEETESESTEATATEESDLEILEKTESSPIDLKSLQPLEEKYITVDLSDWTPLECTMVPFSKIFENEDMRGVKKVAYTDYYYGENYVVADYSSDAAINTVSSSLTRYIVTSGDQLDTGAKRYIVSCSRDEKKEEKWINATVYKEKEDRSKVDVWETDSSFHSNCSYTYIYINEPFSSDSSYYLKFDLNSAYGSSENRSKIRVFEGKHFTAADAQGAKEITDEIMNTPDMTVKGAGYDFKNINYITFVSYDNNGKVTGCLPVSINTKWGSDSDSKPYYMAYMSGQDNEYVVDDYDEYTSNDITTRICTLYKGYPANGKYFVTFDYYEYDKKGNSERRNDLITAAYVGQYSTMAEANAAGASDVKDKLFGDNYDTSGYEADYSKGVYFTFFAGVGNGGQKATVYCVKAEEGLTPENTGDDVGFLGVCDTEGNYLKSYVINARDDDYADGSYPTILVEADADLTKLAPRFYMSTGANLYAADDNTKQISGKSIHDFSKGAVHYTTASEDGSNQKNVWLRVVKAGRADGCTYNLYTNSLSDSESETKTENGVVYSKREIIMPDIWKSRHDILLMNLGMNDIPQLSAELDSAVLVMDEYWTLSGNHSLSGFLTTQRPSGVNYGELGNLAKVGLKVKEGVESGTSISGTLTIKAAGTPIMQLSLTGIAGAPVITTKSIPEAVKYVPYGAMIQNSNKYSKTTVSYELVSGSLPEGMELRPNGELYGVPKQTGEFKFKVCLKSQNPVGEDKREFTLTVKDNTDENVNASSDEGYKVEQRIPTIALSDTSDYTFVSEGQFATFKDIFLDGAKLNRGVDYEAVEGSTRITIKSQTLKPGNETGKHTIGVEFRTENDELKKSAQNYEVVTEKSDKPNQGGSDGNNGGSGGSPEDSGNNSSQDNESQSSTASNSTPSNSTASNSTASNSAASTGTATDIAALNSALSAQNNGLNMGLNQSGDAAEIILYTVVAGDTLSRIAAKFYNDASKWTKIYEDNRDTIKNPNLIRVNQVIKIYPLNVNASAVQQGASAFPGNAGSVSGSPMPEASVPEVLEGTYVIQSGDTLWKIAKKFYGAGWLWIRIFNANRDVITDAGVIHAGQVITIP